MTFLESLTTNNLIRFLKSNKKDISIIIIKDKIKYYLGVLLNYFAHGRNSPIQIRDNTEEDNSNFISKEQLFARIIKTLDA
jgi:hypothetical protein